MARGVNKVILVGNLGKDPDVRYSASGTGVARLSVATATARKDEQSGEWAEQTEWHNVVLFGRQVEVAEKYLRKGRQVYIEGRLQTRKWQDQSGQDRYSTEVIAQDMQMLGAHAEEGSGGYTKAGDSAPRPTPQVASPHQPPPGNFDEDIPF